MDRYKRMIYRYCGNSGLQLPAFSLGLWHNFGTDADDDNCRKMVTGAFDHGITSFDLANNYGPIPGSAEERFGNILREELKGYRDEIVISTKAGYDMWNGPYGKGGSAKYLISSLDQSLERMGIDYVDIFYHHVPDPNTPLEETADALARIVASGKAIYVGISNYKEENMLKMEKLLTERHVHCLINQLKFSLITRSNLPTIRKAKEAGIGTIAFCPLAQGVLTGKYIHGIPSDSRAAGSSVFLSTDKITTDVVGLTEELTKIAEGRNQSLAQMALAWDLRETTCVILGASRYSQIEDNCKALDHLDFSKSEEMQIDTILNKYNSVPEI